jgi:hypothetical protein
LYEEPAGLIASASLLEGSELLHAARYVRNSEGFDGRVVDAVLRAWAQRDKGDAQAARRCL